MDFDSDIKVGVEELKLGISGHYKRNTTQSNRKIALLYAFLVRCFYLEHCVMELILNKKNA